MPAILDPGWTRRRHARLAYIARRRRDRRVRAAQWWRKTVCSHWKTCRHSYSCARLRYAEHLIEEAQGLVDRLAKGA